MKTPTNEYKTYFGFEHLEKLNTASSISFDSETLQLKPEYGKLRLLQLGSTARKTIVVIDMFEDITSDAELDKLALFFRNGDRFWFAHNASFDLGWLQAYDIFPKGQIRCSMLASRLLTNGLPNISHRLADVVQRHLGLELCKDEQRSDFSGTLRPSQLEYAAKDVEVLCELDAPIHQKIANAGLGHAYALECRALPAMAQMANTGLPFDREELEKVHVDYKKDIDNLKREFVLDLDNALPSDYKLPRNEDGTFNTNPRTHGSVRLGTKVYQGFNIASHTQLRDRISAILGETPIDPKTEKPSTSNSALKEYAGQHHVVQTYLSWKYREKRRQLVNTLLEKMEPDGFVRASYLQLGADTGRMTCMSPNLMQIPRDKQFRKCVKAPDGWSLLDADFSQMELRLAAVIAGDEAMMEAFKNGEDLHTATSEAIGCSRQIAKSCNFGLLYGSGAKGLRNYAAGMGTSLTMDEAGDVRSKWLARYHGIKKWQRAQANASKPQVNYLRIKWLESKITEMGHDDEDYIMWSDELKVLNKQKDAGMAEIRIPGSRMRRMLPGDLDRLTIRCNTPVQGAGASILKCALGSLWVHLHKHGPDEAVLAGCVHDEILLLVKEGLEDKWANILKNCMEQAEAKWLGDVPSVADVSCGKTWDEVH